MLSSTLRKLSNLLIIGMLVSPLTLWAAEHNSDASQGNMAASEQTTDNDATGATLDAATDAATDAEQAPESSLVTEQRAIDGGVSPVATGDVLTATVANNVIFEKGIPGYPVELILDKNNDCHVFGYFLYDPTANSVVIKGDVSRLVCQTDGTKFNVWNITGTLANTENPDESIPFQVGTEGILEDEPEITIELETDEAGGTTTLAADDATDTTEATAEQGDATTADADGAAGEGDAAEASEEELLRIDPFVYGAETVYAIKKDTPVTITIDQVFDKRETFHIYLHHVQLGLAPRKVLLDQLISFGGGENIEDMPELEN